MDCGRLWRNSLLKAAPVKNRRCSRLEKVPEDFFHGQLVS